MRLRSLWQLSVLQPHKVPADLFVASEAFQIKARAGSNSMSVSAVWDVMAAKDSSRLETSEWRKHGLFLMCDLRRWITEIINKQWALSCLNASLSTFRLSHAFTLTLFSHTDPFCAISGSSYRAAHVPEGESMWNPDTLYFCLITSRVAVGWRLPVVIIVGAIFTLGGHYSSTLSCCADTTNKATGTLRSLRAMLRLIYHGHKHPVSGRGWLKQVLLPDHTFISSAKVR